MADDQPTYEILMLKKLEGQLSEAEQRELDAWLNASAEHQAQFEQLREVWHITSPDATPLEPDHEAGWARIASRMHAGPADRSPVSRPRKSFSRIGWLVMPLVLFLAVFLWSLRSTQPDMLEYFAERGETASITLADESVVVLNSGSRLTYPAAFSEAERRVVLEGEAIFEVQPGSIPFIVESNQAEVTVLGTRFNVRTWHDATEVMVEEGRVLLHTSADLGISIELSASEGAILNAANELDRLDPTQVANAFSWTEGVIAFDQTPLWQVVEAMERAFDQSIPINPEIANTPVGGTIRTDSLNQALNTICLLAGCTVSAEGDSISLQ